VSIIVITNGSTASDIVTFVPTYD